MTGRVKINLLRAAIALIWIGAVALLALGGWKYLRDNFWFNVKEGNLLYASENFDGAIKKYHDAELYKPESEVLDFNSGNVFYKQENYDKALEKYKESIDAGDRDVMAKAHYNMGNSYFRMDNPEGEDKLKPAIDEYIAALEIDPNDVEAKYNLELARVLLREKLEKQKQQQDKEKNKLPEDKEQQQNPNCPNPQPSDGQGEQQKQQQAQQQENGGGQNNEEKKEEQKKEEEQQAGSANAGDKNKEDEKKNGGEPEKKDGEMTQQEAMRILRALDNKEKDNDKKKMMPIPGSGFRPEKDW